MTILLWHPRKCRFGSVYMWTEKVATHSPNTFCKKIRVIESENDN